MSKEFELTQKLKILGAKRPQGYIEELDDVVMPWSIETCLEWIRNKGWKGYITWGTELSRVSISKVAARWNPENNIEIAVKPSQELEGLLECMIQIAEGE